MTTTLYVSFIQDKPQPYLIIRGSREYRSPSFSTLERIEKIANWNDDYFSTTHLWKGQVNLIIRKAEA